MKLVAKIMRQSNGYFYLEKLHILFIKFCIEIDFKNEN